MLQVQSFLAQKYQETGSIEAAWASLTSELAIKVKHYPESGITLVDYDMIESPKMHPIVIECRSLILDTYTFGIVSKKFSRFFNFGECPEYYVDFDWENASVTNKYDGSLIGVYHHNGVWNISTRGMAYAEGPNQLNTGTFADNVISAFGFASNADMQKCFDYSLQKDATYVFEYCSPNNRIVTPYDKDMMVLTGAYWGTNESDIYTLECIVDLLQECGATNVMLMETYPMPQTPKDLCDMANQLPSLKEGYVVWDQRSGKRCKIKAALYVVAHTLRGNDPLPTKKNLLKLAFSGEMDEFVSYFPEWKDNADSVSKEINDALNELNSVWERTKDIESQKDFALAIKDVRFNGILFSARKLKSTPHDVFASLDANKKIQMFL